MASPTPSSAGQGGIQPRGFLLALAPDWRIVRASANVADFVPGLDGKIVDRLLTDVFGNEAVHALRNRLSLLRDPEGVARLFALQPAGALPALDFTMHLAGGEIILEAQPRAGQESGDPIGLVRELARRLDAQPGSSEILQEAARQLRALTGFECVTLFRYGEAGIAELAAHSARGDTPPASSPSPANRGPRYIGQRTAHPVAIADGNGPALLERSHLRAPTDSECHEMGSAASMLRLPLQAGANQMGIAVCIDQSPRQLSLERIAAAELFADIVALRLAALDRR